MKDVGVASAEMDIGGVSRGPLASRGWQLRTVVPSVVTSNMQPAFATPVTATADADERQYSRHACSFLKIADFPGSEVERKRV